MKQIIEIIRRMLAAFAPKPPAPDRRGYRQLMPDPYDDVHMEPVEFRGHRVFVSADYVHEDGVRQPMGVGKSLAVVWDVGCTLPSPELVDAIWEQADLRLPPQPIPWDDENVTQPVFDLHHDAVENRIKRLGGAGPGDLIAGHKKDVIHDKFRKTGRVAIYGWHRVNGKPIQPLSNAHSASYADYSHGVRLVSRTAFHLEDGYPVNVEDLY